MSIKFRAGLSTLFLLASFAWASEGHDPKSEGSGHAHAGEELTIAITQWTDSMELFMEHPACVAGEPCRFIIHLTILDGFQPVRDGQISMWFRGARGELFQFEESTLLREGIFAPTISINDPGTYRLELSYQGPSATSTFEIGNLEVYPNTEDLHIHAEPEDDSEITFLKEQQWKVPFATREATVREVKQSTWAIGEVMPAPSAYAEIVSPVDGVIGYGESPALPGSNVNRGDELLRIYSTLEGNSWTASQVALAQAERNLQRARRLYETEAISLREFEEAQNNYLVRKAGHDQLQGVDREGALRLVAPISGKVMEWQARPGQRLNAGDKLMSITDPSVVWLRVNVYENDFPNLGEPVGAHFASGSSRKSWTLEAEDMRLLSSGTSLDPVTRTIPVLLEIDNREGRLFINESVPVELISAFGSEALAVPRSAIYEDEGLEVVYVQPSGESFQKRVVKTGPANAGWVSILEGIEVGDRIVTQGGYHVKLASTSAEIGHGHAH